MENKFHISHYVGPIATFITLITSFMSVTWFAATLNERISLVEQTQNQYHEEMNSIAHREDEDSESFHTDVNVQLARLDDKIQKIYGLLIIAKKNQIN